MAGFIKEEIIRRKNSLVIAATTANQTAMSIDLSAYGGSANYEAKGHLLVRVAIVSFSPTTVNDDTYIVRVRRNGTNNWNATVLSTIVGPAASGLTDFSFSTNTLLVRIDGQASSYPYIITAEGTVGVYNTA